MVTPSNICCSRDPQNLGQCPCSPLPRLPGRLRHFIDFSTGDERRERLMFCGARGGTGRPDWVRVGLTAWGQILQTAVPGPSLRRRLTSQPASA